MLIKDGKQDLIRLFLCYDDNNNPVINGIKKISKPGCRNYVASSDIPKVLNGMGISILTTSKGVISNKKAEFDTVLPLEKITPSTVPVEITSIVSFLPCL